jgi:uncharacterized membrane protein
MEVLIQRFCDWLSATPLSIFIQTVTWIIPMVQSVHIFAITVVMGSVLMMDMKLLGVVGGDISVAAMNRRFLPWVWTALVVLFLTGMILTIAEPGRELINNMFRLKMLLVASIIVLTLLFQEVVRRHAEQWGQAPAHPWAARAIAVVSLGFWISIAICGRWIAYVEHQ